MQPIHQDVACRCRVITVCVQGELDLVSVAATQERLHDALSLGPEALVVDLSACPFFDATGINMLLDVHRLARKQRAVLTLSGCSDRHLRLLALMGLRGVFDVSARPGVAEPGTARVIDLTD